MIEFGDTPFPAGGIEGAIEDPVVNDVGHRLADIDHAAVGDQLGGFNNASLESYRTARDIDP